MNLFLVLGNQLFDPAQLAKIKIDKRSTLFFMREDRELATYYRFHKHKIIFFFAAMRTYRDELIKAGYKVHYQEIGHDSISYEDALDRWLKDNPVTSAFGFEIEDKFFETRIINFFKKKKLPFRCFESPMFLTSRPEFKAYLSQHKRPFMKTFYEHQRKRLKILVNAGAPTGGIWSFDTENRLALPKNQPTPSLPNPINSPIVQTVINLVNENFSEHPGDAEEFWLPVDRQGAKSWFHIFLTERLAQFGPFEDAIPMHSEFVFHSVLTPFLNCGLLTPNEVIDEAIHFSQQQDIPLPSLEGFVRQIIGWREFIRGIYQNFDIEQKTKNFWGHQNKLSELWYEGSTGIPPLDETIRRVVKRGYAHHIERLMVAGSLMLLLEVHPDAAYRWFMEMFVDSSDWVMGPNVYGMAMFSDGGIFATKPYICGSNYLRKMGGYPQGDWCDGVDGLYWGFVRKHEKFFLKNPRLSMMAKSSRNISEAKWLRINAAAEALKKRLVIKE
ncbi:MAG TPA: cryptochrome/photolyase family protein [Bdellovibrio sp.]|uniref:cryptochrome/photolyase family protein n=1 Tax=Bdellovibrio sp. TaxID=28201 RepID=UPI002EE6A0B3